MRSCVTADSCRRFNRIWRTAFLLVLAVVGVPTCKSIEKPLPPLERYENKNPELYGAFSGSQQIVAQGKYRIYDTYFDDGKFEREISEARKNAFRALEAVCVPEPPMRIERHARSEFSIFIYKELPKLIKEAKTVSSDCVTDSVVSQRGNLTCQVTLTLKSPNLRQRCFSAYRESILGKTAKD